MVQLTVWMNMPSFYQGDLFRSLVASGKVDLHVIYAHHLSEDRIGLGWQNDLSGYSYTFLEDAKAQSYQSIYRSLHNAHLRRHQLHIVNGIWAEPTFTAALLMLMMNKSAYILYSEAPIPGRKRSKFKQILQTTIGPFLTHRAIGLLPVAHLGANFFKQLGAQDAKIYPFGYFRAQPLLSTHLQNGENMPPKTLNLIFVGQLIRRKGVDLLLEAIAPLTNQYALSLSIIGQGEEYKQLQAQAEKLGIAHCVHFEGVIPSAQIPTRIQRSDLLILPSRWDGWGLVVNEALAVGTPVIVSDRCGASDVIKDGENGYIFTSENIADLQTKLIQILENPCLCSKLRAKAKTTSDTISTEAASTYLLRCIEHMTQQNSTKPSAPWL